MAVTMTMHWPGITKEQYQVARKEVGMDANPPKGLRFHVSSIGDDGFRVTDIWDSAQDFQTYLETRLSAAVAKAGITGQPNVSIGEMLDTLTPGYTAK